MRIGKSRAGRVRAWAAAVLLGAGCVAGLTGCGGDDGGRGGPEEHEHAAPTNRVDINARVRQNLGITFARVERRNVARTLRVPGRFELVPSAEREYRTPVSGQVELLVRQFDQVTEGTPLYRINSPRWRELQRELADADAAVKRAAAVAESIEPFKAAHERHHVELEGVVALWSERVESLEDLMARGGAGGEELAEARASLAAARTALAETFEKEAELAARERETLADLEAAIARKGILLEAAAALTGLPVDALQELDDGAPRRALWERLGKIEVLAASRGIVEALAVTSGGFVAEHGEVLRTVQPQQVRFRAHGLQSDLGKLSGGLPATVVAPQGGSLDGAAPVRGTLTLAPRAEPQRRTIELIVTPSEGEPLPDWARAGVSGFLEVVVEGSGGETLAIPLASVVRDGTQRIIFRRDPRDPDKAIRMEADLGADDGRWVEIKSGVAEGNEIVLDGAYQLMVATSGTITRGGHFHADGTFHEGED